MFVYTYVCRTLPGRAGAAGGLARGGGGKKESAERGAQIRDIYIYIYIYI